MVDAITTAKATMLYDLHRMQSVSQNLANVTTPGYRRSVTSGADFAKVLANLQANPTSTTSVSNAQINSQLRRVEDGQQGLLKQTNNPFDLALDEDSYLELASPMGVLYSKGGHFKIDSGGRLVNAQGFGLQASNGDVVLTGNEFKVDIEGTVWEGERQIGKLNIVRFEIPEHLASIGNGVYAAGPNMVSTANPKGRILQGFLEMSNVNQADEMVRMIEVTRHFETIQRVIKTYDGMMDSAINSIGDL